MTARRDQRLAVVDLQPQPTPPLGGAVGQALRQADRLAEMPDRLGIGRAVKCLGTSLTPPFDRWLVESGLCEVMHQHLWLGGGDRRKLVAQGLGDATVQDGP